MFRCQAHKEGSATPDELHMHEGDLSSAWIFLLLYERSGN